MTLRGILWSVSFNEACSMLDVGRCKMKVGEVSNGSDVIVDESRILLGPVRICRGARTGSNFLLTSRGSSKGSPTKRLQLWTGPDLAGGKPGAQPGA